MVALAAVNAQLPLRWVRSGNRPPGTPMSHPQKVCVIGRVSGHTIAGRTGAGELPESAGELVARASEPSACRRDATQHEHCQNNHDSPGARLPELPYRIHAHGSAGGKRRPEDL